MSGDYGDWRGPQGKLHPGGFTRGCYYGPTPGRNPPCVLCALFPGRMAR